ncbi:zinc knuckle, partial [Paraphaeosphaeria sporulosa]
HSTITKRTDARNQSRRAEYAREQVTRTENTQLENQNAPTARDHTAPAIEAAPSTKGSGANYRPYRMHRELKIYQANVRRMSETQHSIMNAEYLRDYALLLFQEPHVYQDEEGSWQSGPRNHAYWKPMLPETNRGNNRPRAMIWTNKDLTTRPINTRSPDLAAALVEIGDRQALVISVYIPIKTSRTNPELPESLRRMERIINETRRSQRNRVELILAGDFNRHDQLWGGDHVGTTDRQGEAEGIIDLMANLDLQSLAPQGTATWHSDDDSRASTIDLILATPELANEVCSCSIDETEHGSDHSAIRTKMVVEWQSPDTKPRKLWRKTRWSDVRRMVEAAMHARPEPQDYGSVNAYCEYIMELVTPAVEKHVPVAKPSPYAKRWWNEDLTKLRADYTF